MKITFLDSIQEVSKDEWERVLNSDYPFLKYDFLKTLEITKCVSPEQGWTPLHLVVSSDEEILALMPLYIKTDSQGEFIFDWSWADAYYRNGLEALIVPYNNFLHVMRTFLQNNERILALALILN